MGVLVWSTFLRQSLSPNSRDELAAAKARIPTALRSLYVSLIGETPTSRPTLDTVRADAEDTSPDIYHPAALPNGMGRAHCKP